MKKDFRVSLYSVTMQRYKKRKSYSSPWKWLLLCESWVIWPNFIGQPHFKGANKEKRYVLLFVNERCKPECSFIYSSVRGEKRNRSCAKWDRAFIVILLQRSCILPVLKKSELAHRRGLGDVHIKGSHQNLCLHFITLSSADQLLLLSLWSEAFITLNRKQSSLHRPCLHMSLQDTPSSTACPFP